MKTVAIIQARMSSTRLPGKVLADIAGQPMLVHVFERTCLSKTIDQVVLATTNDPTDDPIEMLCADRGYPCYRGSPYDVLDRYYQAARLFQADVVVRITADCPLIDPGVVDKTVREFLNGEFSYDFAANRLPPPWGRTYPIGLDVEVCTFSGLETAWSEARLPHQREHVMPFFYDQPQRFRILHVNHPVDYGSLRWTVDTPQDLELVRQIFAHFPGRQDFSWLEVLSLFEREPELAKINIEIKAKDYRLVDDRRPPSADSTPNK
jgi:spore coat polysaccharide biosynthesis protein SpsF